MIVQYRGSLRSCNYSCSYCPFSKKKSSEQEREQDKEALFRFYESLRKKNREVEALQIVPYGEAMVYTYYWEFLAKVSQIEGIQAVGIQTNLSFSPELFFDAWEKWGGISKKLRIWATFHPSMTQSEPFLRTATALKQKGIGVCIGAVGVPKQMECLQAFYRQIPSDITFWVNAMEGMGRAYQKEEILQFQSMDENFEYELKHWEADVSYCKHRCFVEADGRIYRCNISRQVIGNWYADDSHQMLAFDTAKTECKRKECSCFLAYSNRSDFLPKKSLGEFPMFRIALK